MKVIGDLFEMNLKDLVGETTIDNLERITQGLKLLELIEKRIMKLDLTASTNEEWMKNKNLILKEFKNLLEDSKK